ncbi:MAG: hypothetical protein H7831_03460 [Magnetococcus sp. WYHC-3]
MRPSQAAWRRFRLTGWLGFFGLILFGGHATTYLAPAQQWIFQVGGALLALVLALDLLWEPEGGGSVAAPPFWSSLLASGVHWVPLLVFLLAGVTSLKLPEGTVPQGGIQTRLLDPSRLAADGAGPGGELSDGSVETDLIRLLGREIPEEPYAAELVGRVMRLTREQIGESFVGWPEDVEPVILYRYAVACCAADATPLGIALLDLGALSFPQDGWVRVRGQVVPFLQDPFRVGLRVESLEETDKPDNPYLFWLSSL